MLYWAYESYSEGGGKKRSEGGKGDGEERPKKEKIEEVVGAGMRVL